VNKRSEVIWRFREALDPEQEGGSPIALPDDRLLVADLTAPSFEVTPRGIKVEDKESVCERLGRSTNHGDAVQIAWATGPQYAVHTYADGLGTGEQVRSGRRRPQVILAYEKTRKICRR
jgi:hypothetical protein